MVKDTIGSLFDDAPGQWGLRGDPYLWKEMADLFKFAPLPQTTAELEKELLSSFLSITGKPISVTDHFFVEKFAHGGMSSGHISPQFWRDKALPLLLSRFETLSRGR